jgi:hypothetical protein
MQEGSQKVILAQLPEGAKVREKTSGVIFLIGEHNHPGYQGTTLVADHVLGQGCLDAPEDRNPDQRLHLTGYNYYAFCNLHQWLNAEDEDWYQPAHEFDAPPTEENLARRPNAYDSHGYNDYAKKPGFLSWFGEAFREAIFESEMPCTNRPQNAIEFVRARAFLLSTAEAGIRTSDPLQEGSKIAVFNDFRNRVTTPSAEAVAASDWQPAYLSVRNLFWYWLRTPKLNDAGFTYYAHTSCPYSHKFSCCPWVGIRPALNVDSQLPVAASQNVGGLFLIG